MNSNNTISLLISLLLLLTMSPPAIADGLVSNGHINGSHTDMTLTRDQIVALDHGQKKITLTAEQRKQLAHLRHSSRVKQLRVFPKTVETCTCELADVAIRASKSSIEVADRLFGRDAMEDYQRQQLWNKRRAEEKQEMEWEERNPFSSKEAFLWLKGLSYAEYQPQTSIECYQAALKHNPNYKWTRRSLSRTYYDLALLSDQKNDNPAKACNYLELALSNADPTDTVMIGAIKSNLQLAKQHNQKPTSK